MNTIFNNLHGDKSNTSFSYLPPKEWRGRGKLKQIFPPLSQNSKKLGFDIYDFEMLFNDEETNQIIRTGKTIGCFYIESPGMQALLRKLDCHTFEMLQLQVQLFVPVVLKVE
jgi:DNA polymerase III alpha subunit